MKKVAKTFTLLLSTAFVASAFAFTSCDAEEVIEFLSDTTIAEMNTAVTETKNYNGSYTIKETTTSKAYMNGMEQSVAGADMTAEISYNAETGACYYGAKQSGTEIFVYTVKEETNSYVQYIKQSYNKQATRYADLQSLKTNGLKGNNPYDTTKKYEFYLDSLTYCVDNVFLVDLEEASAITNAEEYSAFWSTAYQLKLAQVATAYGFTSIEYTNGGSKLSVDGEVTTYSFTINGVADSDGSLAGVAISDYSLKLVVEISVENGKLIQLENIITQDMKMTTQGQTMTVSTKTTSIDDFTYSFDSSIVPAQTVLDEFTITDFETPDSGSENE